MRVIAQRKRPGAGNTEPLNSDALGQADTGYHDNQNEGSGSVVSFNNRHRSLRCRASQRLAQLYRLALFRRHHGLACDGNTFAFALAATLACGKPGKAMFRGRVNRSARLEARPTFLTWEGLDVSTLNEAVYRASLGRFSRDELGTIIEAVRRYEDQHSVTWISARRLGELLQVTSVERDAARVWSVDAVDEPASERRKRKALERRTRDREAKRTARGRVPRPVYEGRSVEKSKPWAAEGISRRTWYRRRKEQTGTDVGTGVSADDIFSTHRATHLCHVASLTPGPSAQGPAKLTGGRRTVGAGGHAPCASPIDDEPSRSHSASAFGMGLGGRVGASWLPRLSIKPLRSQERRHAR